MDSAKFQAGSAVTNERSQASIEAGDRPLLQAIEALRGTLHTLHDVARTSSRGSSDDDRGALVRTLVEVFGQQLFDLHRARLERDTPQKR